jgi:hypothetical protein
MRCPERDTNFATAPSKDSKRQPLSGSDEFSLRTVRSERWSNATRWPADSSTAIKRS